MSDTDALPIKNLSGYQYVAATLRCDTGARRMPKIRIAQPRNCDHTETICATKACVESWSIDWDLHFDRTGGGRGLRAEIDRG